MERTLQHPPTPQTDAESSSSKPKPVSVLKIVFLINEVGDQLSDLLETFRRPQFTVGLWPMSYLQTAGVELLAGAVYVSTVSCLLCLVTSIISHQDMIPLLANFNPYAGSSVQS